MADEDTTDAPDTGAADDQDQDTGSLAPGWTPPASQDELNKIIQDRVKRATKRYANYDQLVDKAGRLDALENELASETDKAVRAARDEERKAVTSQYAPRLVRTEFRAAARGVLSTEQLDALLEDLDLGKYVTDEGDVDTARVAKKIDAIAPAKEDRKFPDLGGGRRGGTPTTKNMNEIIRRAAGLSN